MAGVWEYKDFVYSWEQGHRGWVSVDTRFGGSSLSGARLEIWSWSQSEILEAVQKWMDKGWVPITDVGPASLQLNDYHRLNVAAYLIFAVCTVGLGFLVPFFFLYPVVESVEVRIKMRRRKSK